MLYFGWLDNNRGHALYSKGGIQERLEKIKDFPVHYVDGALLPRHSDKTQQGQATFVHINGWTILSFWDCSGDSRPASNSTFLERGRLTFDDMVTLAKQTFPEVWKRFTFEVVDAWGINNTQEKSQC